MSEVALCKSGNFGANVRAILTVSCHEPHGSTGRLFASRHAGVRSKASAGASKRLYQSRLRTVAFPKEHPDFPSTLERTQHLVARKLLAVSCHEALELLGFQVAFLLRVEALLVGLCYRLGGDNLSKLSANYQIERLR